MARLNVGVMLSAGAVWNKVAVNVICTTRRSKAWSSELFVDDKSFMERGQLC